MRLIQGSMWWYLLVKLLAFFFIYDLLFVLSLNRYYISIICLKLLWFSFDFFAINFLWINRSMFVDWLIDLLCLMPLSAIFQLYHGDQFYWWKKPEYLERTTDHGQATGKLYHLKLLVKCFFVIYKAGHEPTPYWW